MRFRRVIILAASVLLLAGVALSQRNNTPEARLRAAMDKETVDGDLKAAIDGYKQVINQRGASREVVAQAVLRLGLALEKQGDAEARKSYERLVSEFADQPGVVQQARARLASTQTATSGPTIRQVCAGDACNGFTVSPDGRQLITLNGNVSLLIRDLATGQSKQLAAAPAGRRICCLEISPDGKRIAYTLAPSSQDSAAGREVVVVNADGGEARTVYRGGSSEEWSPDGRRIIVSTSSGVSWLTIADGTTQSIGTGAWENMDIFKVSPDGKYIAFSGNKATEDMENVYIMAADGSGQTRVSASPIYQEPVGWSPDGKYLLYGQYGSSASLWSVPVADGRVRGPAVSVRQFEGRVTLLRVTPSGTLYYRDLSSAGDLYTASMDPVSGKVTSIPAAVPTTSIGNGPVAWSPDSRRIAALANGPNGTREIHVLSPEEGKDRRVPTTVSPVNSLCWPSGGDAILTNTSTGRPARFDPVRVDLTTGEFKTAFPGAPSFRLWNCTDTVATNIDAVSVKVRNLQTGVDTELYRIKRPTANYGMSNISPDGRSVAFLESLDADTSVLMTVPSNGGPARELARAKAPAQLQQIHGHEWSHDSRFVYFLKRANSNAPHELYRVPIGGGTEESMGLQGMELRGLEIAPDGTKIAFVIGAFNRPEIWAMDNFLPPAK